LGLPMMPINPDLNISASERKLCPRVHIGRQRAVFAAL
jgi:hypothetical protein